MTKPGFWVVVALLALLALLALNGCDLKSAIRVDVPPDVADSLQIVNPANLGQGEQIAADWASYVERNTHALGIAIGDAEDRYIALRSISDLGLQAAGTASATMPGGALLLSGLTLLGGLFIPRPGSQTQLRQEKEDSYNAGLERGQEFRE